MDIYKCTGCTADDPCRGCENAIEADTHYRNGAVGFGVPGERSAEADKLAESWEQRNGDKDK